MKPRTFGEYSAECIDRLGIDIERRPANALNVEYMSPLPRCRQLSPDGRGTAWLASGGSPLAYGHCCRSVCPRLNGGDTLVPMASDFEETVKKIVDVIGKGHVILTERIRAGRKRAISVGPYRTATSKRQYGLIITPPPEDVSDLRVYGGPDKAAREFVRFVGVEAARDAIVRESRKRLG